MTQTTQIILLASAIATANIACANTIHTDTIHIHSNNTHSITVQMGLGVGNQSMCMVTKTLPTFTKQTSALFSLKVDGSALDDVTNQSGDFNCASITYTSNGQSITSTFMLTDHAGHFTSTLPAEGYFNL